MTDTHAEHIEAHRRHLAWVRDGRWTVEDRIRGWRPARNDAPQWHEEPASWAVETSEGTNTFEHEADALEFTRLARLGGQSIFDEPTFQPAVRYDRRRTFTCRDITARSQMDLMNDALMAHYVRAIDDAIFRSSEILAGL